jgi:hypothetical protein
MRRKYNKKGGSPILPLNPANFTASPNNFTDGKILINNDSYAGTKSNVDAAAGNFTPYTQNGGSVYCTSETPLVSGLNMGYASVKPCATFNETRPLEIKSKSGGRRRKHYSVKKRRKRSSSSSSSRRRKSKSLNKHHRELSSRNRAYIGGRRKRHSSSTTKKRRKSKSLNKHHRELSSRNRAYIGGGPSGHSSTIQVGTTVPPTTNPPLRQPNSNIPFSQGYSIGGDLTSNNSALANPAPFTSYNNCPTN